MAPVTGFVPPPYPHDRLGAFRRLAEVAPGGILDCSVGSPTDPVPGVVRVVLEAGITPGYPPSIGSEVFRSAAAEWMERRLGVTVEPDAVIACVGTKELVASLPRMLHLRNPERDTVLYPAVSYPTYAMGATLAGLRPVPVQLTDDWHLDLETVAPDDAHRALLLWVNQPGNPTGSAESEARFGTTVQWARSHGVTVASDECYVEFTGMDGSDPAPATVLSAGSEGVLAVHSLSKRSNMAGLRAGFVAGDPDLVEYLGLVRKHAGLMVPAPVQAAAAAALGDDAHVDQQRRLYIERRAVVLETLEPFGLLHDGGTATFYLWLRSDDGTDDGWEVAGRLAEAGTLVAPGDLYGPAGADHVRLALVHPAERLAEGLARLGA
ncbi:MAG: aminotransferase class I/II-fold pyridoxal phosphate-dependent enzyme [Acidimicrobiia bacterium]|nr:aminotransferase class I/II-fold pyridoxal phosphate-dependent enzyme [Acidimicrobiia bacterium]